MRSIGDISVDLECPLTTPNHPIFCICSAGGAQGPNAGKDGSGLGSVMKNKQTIRYIFAKIAMHCIC